MTTETFTNLVGVRSFGPVIGMVAVLLTLVGCSPSPSIAAPAGGSSTLLTAFKPPPPSALDDPCSLLGLGVARALGLSQIEDQTVPDASGSSDCAVSSKSSSTDSLAVLIVSSDQTLKAAARVNPNTTPADARQAYRNVLFNANATRIRIHGTSDARIVTSNDGIAIHWLCGERTGSLQTTGLDERDVISLAQRSAELVCGADQ